MHVPINLLDQALLMELVDITDLKSVGRLGCAGSSPAEGTTFPTQHNSLQVKNFAKLGYFDNSLINLYHQRPLYLALISGQINGQKS